MACTVDGSFASCSLVSGAVFAAVLAAVLCLTGRCTRAGADVTEGGGGGGRRRGRVGDGAGEEGETAGSSLGAVYSCTCVVGGGGGGGGVEGVVGEDEAYVIFFKHVWTFQNLR